jgi:EAL domain-containing protein (putative c-di-GMP-specific phosphodiesterase class I)
MHRSTKVRSELREDAAAALENGQIQPWFQPQISTDTGRVTGFEALARWTHPVHGPIPPDQFLPVMENAGLLERLGEVMLYHALTALKAWDCAGVHVPRVGVNFASAELHNPRLVDKIRWELDRFDLTPDRLSVEILESVVTDAPDDVVVQNIAGLAKLGCRIDLDDFGTGHASIASMRRFTVSRIKIDRSFVMKSDQDPNQQKLIGAILTMAERLEIETLAEGVETVGEHALLAQLGCDHVQGFGIARPMPFDETLDWISGHQAKLQEAPQIGRKTG